MNPYNATFYVTGGTLQRDAPCYVPRKADTDLLEGLLAGRFCYVLTSRQMGKSSLMVRTAARLREQGVAVAVLDLQAIGQNLSPEQWYDGLLGRIGRQLDLEDEVDTFWLDNERVGPLQRFMRAIREVVLAKVPGKVVIFVDEIDSVRPLPFSTDEFFAAIRECYNGRVEDPELNRLTFSLLGVATPSELIRDPHTTPFNIGRRIELTDFTPEEAAPLAQGLGLIRTMGLRLLQRILYWTGGHPYLTQRLCMAAAETAGILAEEDIDRLCEELFLSARARERDDNLLFVRERLLHSEGDLERILELYTQIHSRKPVRDDSSDTHISALRLAGIVRAVGGLLEVRNRIYSQVFDRKWARTNMPVRKERQTVSLLWQLRYRGVAPLGANNLTDAGHLLAIRPHEMQARTSQVVILSPEGEPRDVYTLIVEKLNKIETTPDGAFILGHTERDIYHFREGSKTRLFADRRASYTDLALARAGNAFIYSWCDMMGTSHAVGFSDAAGKQGWARKMLSPVSRIAITDDGSGLVIGGANGALLRLDTEQNVVWEAALEEPIAFLALRKPDGPCVVGMEQGGILKLDASGALLWKTALSLPIRAVGLPASGEWVAAAAGDSAHGVLACLGADGNLLWETDLDYQPSGLSVSPDGRYIGLSLVDGRLFCYETHFDGVSGSAQDQGMQEVEALVGSGELDAAYLRLLRLLETHPNSAPAGHRLTEIADLLAAERVALARRHGLAGEYEAALALLVETQKTLPYHETLFHERCALLDDIARQMRAEAQDYADMGNVSLACARLKALLHLAPHCIAAREMLTTLSQRMKDEG